MNNTPRLSAAGRLAAAFVNSKLTPLFVLASVLLGIFAVVKLPREEEPQIIVPMIDIFVEMPGSSAREVEERVTKPMEKLLWEIPGVEYIYSTSSRGGSMAVVRFLVGQDDPVVKPADAIDCARRFPDGECLVVRGLGHGDDRFAEHVRDFLATQLGDWAMGGPR